MSSARQTGEPPAPKVEAVLFDFGGVFTLSPFDTVREAASERGLDPDLAIELCFGSYGDDSDHPWHRLERGEVSLADARSALVGLASGLGIELDPLSLLIRLNREDEQHQAVIDRALQVKSRAIRTACVTNNILEFGDAWRAMVPVDALFDVVVDSCVTGVRKPNPEIFRLALDALGSAPESTVLLDDHPGNIDAAVQLGIRGILVGADRLAAFDQLDTLLAA